MDYPIIKPEDIQQGDRVRVTNGAGSTTEGTVAKLSGCCWVDRVDDEVICTIGVVGVPIYLVGRPKEQLPTKPVAQIIATNIQGEEGYWEMAQDRDGDWFEVNGAYIGDNLYFLPRDIYEWQLVESD